MSIIQDIRDAFSRRDNVLTQLILVNVLLWAGLIIFRGICTLTQARETYDLVLRQVVLSPNLATVLRHPWTILTYAFAHLDILHILSNMLGLYWFGRLIPEYLGNQRLLALYILGGLAGAFFYLAAYNFLPGLQSVIAGPEYILGASASVTAIVVGAATLLPDYTFMLILLGPVKIKWIALVTVLLSWAAISGGNPGGGIAHLGGALLGFIFIKQLKSGTDIGTPIVVIGKWFSRVTTRRPDMRVTHRQAAATARPTSASGSGKAAGSSTGQEEIDLILDKISRSGYESLSKDEKQKLFRASQQ